jgi:tetratricopeptide (TPR) repeat protein
MPPGAAGIRRRSPWRPWAAWALIVLAAGCGRSDLDEHLRKGHELFAAGQYEEAQLEGLFVLQRERENETALDLVARSLLAQDRDGEAEAYFRTLAAISPAYAFQAAALYDARAREDYEAGETSRAARRWTAALEFDPWRDLGRYAFFMAERKYQEREWGVAAALYEAALAAYPDTAAVQAALFPYGVSLHNLERWPEALRVLERFLRSYPRHQRRHEAIWLYQEILIHEARAASARMDYEGAIEMLRKVLRYDINPPKTAEALLELGACYENLQDYDAAADCYRRIVEGNAAGTGRIYDAAIARLETLEKARLE